MLMRKELISQRLVNVIEKNGFSQEQIAMFLGNNMSVVSQLEAGDSQLTVDVLEKLGNLYGYTLSKLRADTLEKNAYSFAYSPGTLTAEDMKAISAVNRIFLNVCFLDDLLLNG